MGNGFGAVGTSVGQRLAFGVGQASYLMRQGDGYEASHGCKGEETLLGQGTATWGGRVLEGRRCPGQRAPRLP